ncbi:unnamed protein product [Rodentolepis nana]|uniref:Uncharacterized protein n=1 Tax=Rodentolepis nana TaxID=102285 RepID=A0A0R3TH92_RODNA|nr:unnamed protein product [Rodentolepis nana]
MRSHRPLRQSIETINVNYSADQWLVCTVEAANSFFRKSQDNQGQLSCRSMAPSLHWESQGNVGAGVYSELFPTLVHSSLMGHT